MSELHDAIERAIKEHCAGGDLWLCAHIASEPFDARIAELEREIERLDAQWRDELRIYRETEDVRIAELVDLLEPAAVDYLHALLMRVDAALARAGNGGGV